MSYSTTQDIWKNLGKDAYTKIRTEVVGTSSTTASTSWSLDHDNVISGSTTLYTDSTAVPTSSYTLNLDDGNVTGLSVNSGSVLTADYDYGDLADSIISDMISSSDSLIENETGRKFTNNTNSTEYLTCEEKQTVWFLKNYPVITLSSVARNTAVQTATPIWETLSAGLGNDYIANSEDLSIGRIRFIDSKPFNGEDMLKVIYDYGYTSTPQLVKELSILLTIRQLANSSLYKSIVKGYDNFTPVRLNEIEERIEELKRVLRKQSIEAI